MKTIQTIILLMLCTQIMASCNNSKATNVSNQAVNEANITENKVNAENASIEKGVAGRIASVNKAGKAVFLVVFDQIDAKKDKAMSIVKKAIAQNNNLAEIVELNTRESINKDLVTKFRLTGAPLPLIIVMDKNGIPSGGLLLDQATPDALLELIPSPKYSEVLKALADKKSVFIVAYKETMLEKNKAIVNCNNAAKAMNKEAEVVLLKIDNSGEKSLIENLRINTISTEPVIYAINNSGQITGTFTSKTNVAQLTAAAKKVASGCGSGCASGCK